MPTKRAASKGASPAIGASNSQASSPLLSATLVLMAIGYGLMLLIDRQEVSWPPSELLASLSTLAGCLAMVGPVLLWRIGSAEGTVGELTWIVGGLLLWTLNLSALVEGQTRGLDWTAPAGPELLGPISLAVMLGAWRTGRIAWSWTWTSVTGWVLGLIWIGMGIFAMLPQQSRPFGSL